jgi:hypothetical protein
MLKDEAGEPLFFEDHADYEFRIVRVLGDWFLVGAFEELGRRYPAAHHFRIKLSDPTMTPILGTQAEWGEGTDLPIVRKGILRPTPDPLPSDPATFDGKHFLKTGAHWTIPSEYGSRLSPDSRLLILQSETKIPKKVPFAENTANVYWDVFNIQTGERLITIQGKFSATWVDTASYELRRAGWLTERYFIIPLGEHIERCLVCDFHSLNH